MGTCSVALLKTDHVDPSGSYKRRICEVTMSSSYATGGDTLTLSSLGMKSLSSLKILGYTSTGAALFHVLTPIFAATELGDAKIMARDVTTGAEVTNAQNISTMIVRVEAMGEGPFSA